MTAAAEARAALADDRGEPLFDARFMDLLEYLHVIARKILSGQIKAQRRSRKKGVSPEFADHRPYAPGDDFRFIDWAVFFRTDHLFLKLFEEEEDLHIYLLLDCSGSMDFGMPYKFHYARRLAAAIGYLGLAGLDRVHVLPFSGELARTSGDTLHLRGKGKIHRLMNFLEGCEAAGPTDLASAMGTLASGRHRRGLAVILSDLYDAEGVYRAINTLFYRKFEPYVIHIVSPQETDPTLLGDLRLIDTETGRQRDVTLNEGLLRRYRTVFGKHCDGVEHFCRARGIGYARCSTALPFQDAVLHMLRRGKLFQ